MLWNLVFDYFVQYIFGGITSSGETFSGFLGFGYLLDQSGNLQYEEFYNDVFLIKVLTGYSDNNAVAFGSMYIPLGNYLSLIATIITMVAILLFCVFIIKKIIAIIFRLFTGSSAF